MKKILVSLSIISLVGAIAIGGTMAYFNDTEISNNNTFAAGEIDLKIDYHCLNSGCGWDTPIDLLFNESMFYNCDVKPGDSQSSSISWHVYNNNSWGSIKLNLVDYEFGCTEPERLEDITCGNAGLGEGELSNNLMFDIWMDEGQLVGWQCGNLGPHCALDPKEGNSIKDGIENYIVENISAKQISSMGRIILPQEIIASNTYYLGIIWKIPGEITNIIQSDSIRGSIIMEAVQSRNNPNRIFP